MSFLFRALFGNSVERQHGRIFACWNALGGNVGCYSLMFLLRKVKAHKAGLPVGVDVLGIKSGLEQVANQFIQRTFVMEHGQEFELFMLGGSEFELRLENDFVSALGFSGILKQKFCQELTEADVVFDAVVLDRLAFVVRDFDVKKIAAWRLGAWPEYTAQI